MLCCALWTRSASWLATMQIQAWNKKHPGVLQKEARSCLTSDAAALVWRFNHTCIYSTQTLKWDGKLASATCFSYTAMRLNGAQKETFGHFCLLRKKVFRWDSSMSETAQICQDTKVCKQHTNLQISKISQNLFIFFSEFLPRQKVLYGRLFPTSNNFFKKKFSELGLYFSELRLLFKAATLFSELPLFLRFGTFATISQSCDFLFYFSQFI